MHDKLSTFYDLEPNQILDFIGELGQEPTGQIYQLNSYENRVFDIFLESGERWVAKFYRPLRWKKESIQEEHDFCFEIEEAGFPVISPMRFDGDSVLDWRSLHVAIFPRKAGRNPDELLARDFRDVGGKLALLHNIGARKKTQHRLKIGTKDYLGDTFKILPDFLAPEVATRYWQAVNHLADYVEENVEPLNYIRIQGDCHKGNLIFDGDEFMFVDFDDFCMGPAVQDIWMLTYSPDPSEYKVAMDHLLNSYENLRHFDDSELQHVEALRGLRIIYYATWIAKRWQDPSFQRLFPQFTDYTYWAEEVEAIESIAWRLS